MSHQLFTLLSQQEGNLLEVVHLALSFIMFFYQIPDATRSVCSIHVIGVSIQVRHASSNVELLQHNSTARI